MNACGSRGNRAVKSRECRALFQCRLSNSAANRREYALIEGKDSPLLPIEYARKDLTTCVL
jgi:hypothetical protein